MDFLSQRRSELSQQSHGSSTALTPEPARARAGSSAQPQPQDSQALHLLFLGEDTNPKSCA